MQLALWFEMQVPGATGIGLNTDGTYSVPGQENAFAVNLNGNPLASAIVTAVNTYLRHAQNATLGDDWLDATPAGNATNRGQSVLIPSTLIDNLASDGPGPHLQPDQRRFACRKSGTTSTSLT